MSMSGIHHHQENAYDLKDTDVCGRAVAALTLNLYKICRKAYRPLIMDIA